VTMGSLPGPTAQLNWQGVFSAVFFPRGKAL
jgi:hypothetical protein